MSAPTRILARSLRIGSARADGVAAVRAVCIERRLPDDERAVSGAFNDHSVHFFGRCVRACACVRVCVRVCVRANRQFSARLLDEAGMH